MGLGPALPLRCFCFCVRPCCPCCCCGCPPPLTTVSAGGAEETFDGAGFFSSVGIAPPPPPPPPFVRGALAARLVLEGFGAAPARVTPRCFCFSLFFFLEGAAPSAIFGFFLGLLDGDGGDEGVEPTLAEDGGEGF